MKLKWIAGALGFAAGGTLGAIAGFVIGSMIDAFTSGAREVSSVENDAMRANGDRNGFLFTLLVLCAHVISADGKIMHSEMEKVRLFLRTSFGADAEREGNEILKRLFEYKKQQGEARWKEQIRDSCRQVAMALPEEQRIQLMAFLADICRADGRLDNSEIEAMRFIAANLSLPASVVDQVLAIGGRTVEEAYRVLGVTPEATDDEVRRAYKKLMVQYHPDRVARLGEDVRAAATAKAQQINEAKEIIYKARGM